MTLRQSYILLIELFLVVLSCQSQTLVGEKEQIVIINVSDSSWSQIAKALSTIDKLGAKVIAFDMSFEMDKNSSGRKELISSLWNCRSQLVLPTKIRNLDSGKISISLVGGTEFYPSDASLGYVSEIGENGQRQTKWFTVTQQSFFDDDLDYHFAVSVAMAFDSLKTRKFIDSNSNQVFIDYREGRRNFRKVNINEILDGEIKMNDIKDKIVMFGFLGPGSEDKVFTPLNKDKREPDMYGVEYLANIVSQILEWN